jgi:hypothetical protein
MKRSIRLCLVSAAAIPCLVILLTGRAAPADQEASALGMTTDPEGRRSLNSLGAKGFVATSFEDYEPVFTMMEAAGIDRSHWAGNEIP